MKFFNVKYAIPASLLIFFLSSCGDIDESPVKPATEFNEFDSHLIGTWSLVESDSLMEG